MMWGYSRYGLAKGPSASGLVEQDPSSGEIVPSQDRSCLQSTKLCLKPFIMLPFHSIPYVDARTRKSMAVNAASATRGLHWARTCPNAHDVGGWQVLSSLTLVDIEQLLPRFSAPSARVFSPKTPQRAEVNQAVARASYLVN